MGPSMGKATPSQITSPIEPGDVNPKDLVGGNKPSLHLIPPAASIQEAMVLRSGANKYGPYNWREHSIQATIYISATMRHLAAWQDGEDLDPESGFSHLAHARATLGILLDALSSGKVLDDRPTPGAAPRLIKEHTRNPEEGDE